VQAGQSNELALNLLPVGKRIDQQAVVTIDRRDEIPVRAGRDAFSVSTRNREPAFRIQRDFRSTAKHRWPGRAIPAHSLPLRDTMRQPPPTVNQTNLTFPADRQTVSEHVETPVAAAFSRPSAGP